MNGSAFWMPLGKDKVDDDSLDDAVGGWVQPLSACVASGTRLKVSSARARKSSLGANFIVGF